MNCSVWYIYVLSLCLVWPVQSREQQSGRFKRFLLFPRQSPTRHQFIAGIGIPADLAYESLTVGHVLKAEFFLPYNETVFRQNPYLPEYKLKKENLHYNVAEVRQLQQQPTDLRWNIYAYIEHMLNGYGYKGHECVLQAICEAKAIQFSKDFNVVHELLHIILSPSSTLNENSVEAYDFQHAEESKKNNCEIYDCKFKLLDWISKVMSFHI